MELRDYLHLLRRRWAMIAAFVIAAVAASALVTFNMTPEYSSSARLFVSSPQNDTASAYEGSLLSQQRVSSYADLVVGNQLAERVIARDGLKMSPEDLTKKITATVVPDTVVLEITVTDSSPQRAQRLAQDVATTFRDFVPVLETARGNAANAPIKATIVNAPTVPDSPVSPQPVRNLAVAAVLGLLIGYGAAVLREMLDTTVKSQQDVSAATGTAVMGDIPFEPGAAKQPLITGPGTKAGRLEAFRVLRTNLQFVDVDNQSKVFVVTSSVPDEGKTSTATNLAIAIAQAGQKVVLVEGDLRRPKIAEYLQLEGTVGLTTVLVGRIAVEEAVQDHTTPNLSVLTSGTIPPNPSELLQSRAMTDLLADLRDRYDVVIVDAPPLLPVTDAALLTVQSDGALLVVRQGKTTKDQLRHSMDRLRAVEGRALGVVLNMTTDGGPGTYEYKSHYKNDYPSPPKDHRGFQEQPRARRPQDTKQREVPTPTGALRQRPSEG